MFIKIALTVLYVAITLYLGYRGWKETKIAKDYLIAGRSMGGFVMSLSYGATFISTSAIIGFGGAAALFGFPLLWLTFLNIFVGIFIAFVFFGSRVRRMGIALDAHTFPELLGRRYKSRFLQGFAGLVIFLFLPIYAGAVLIALARLVEVYLGINYHVALLGCSFLIAAYVLTGGIKAVMYTDAFQGCVMFVVMAAFLIATYYMAGGWIDAHKALTDMVQYYPENLKKGGMIGWTQGAVFATPLWLTIYTTIVLGVGIGVLAQPQLAVRFMTVKSEAQLNRGVIYGGFFILCMTGVAFVVGALSNVVFFKDMGMLEKVVDGVTKKVPAISVVVAGGNIDKIIPTYIEKMFPDWFATVFLLAMFAAAMSTLSAQYHAGGTSFGRDFYEKFLLGKGDTMYVTRVGVAATIILTLVWGMVLPESIVALATAFFFGLCSSSFLPVFVLGIYWKGVTKAGAVASMVGGFAVSTLYALFIHQKEAVNIGLCKYLFGVDTLVSSYAPMSTPWKLMFLDQNVVALPISFAIAIIVSLLTTKIDEKHLARCWKNF
ncbi:MAG TPA: sodium:solute symporter family protein [Desulfomonilaceae bacterium]|nr:sodium:solute symporter family protein [Desulfomonilaceae bacterium]